MIENNLLSSTQSGFKPNDSCVHQLISITHSIFSNPSLEVRGVFLNLSKAFERVWHKGFLRKLKNSGINLLHLIESFLHSRRQKVVLNSQSSNWKFLKAGVPQGSVLGPLFFFVYIKDLPQALISNVKHFTDDTALFSTVNWSKASASVLNSDLLKNTGLGISWKMSFNPDWAKQTQEVIFSRKTNKIVHSLFYFNSATVKLTHTQKHLGLQLDSFFQRTY